MAQLAVYRDKNPRSRAAVPFLLNVQSDLLEEMHSRVVIPQDDLGPPVGSLAERQDMVIAAMDFLLSGF